MDTELATRMALRDSRVQLQLEMRRALSCIKKLEKIKLAREWEEKYNPLHYRELIKCAKNKEVAAVIANWKIEDM
jgi:hypothetical protein